MSTSTSRQERRRLRVADEGVEVEVGGAVDGELPGRIEEEWLTLTTVAIDLELRLIARLGSGEEEYSVATWTVAARSLATVNVSVR